MRKFVFLFSLLYATVGVSATVFSDTTKYKLASKLKGKTRAFNEKVFEEVETIQDTIKLQNMTVLEFKKLLGWHESRNNYRSVNQFGFKGKYGFSDYLIGKLTKLTPNQFINNPQEQEVAMNKAIFYYLRFIKREKFLKYINRKVGGLTITLETLLAGCHFSPTYLEVFLRSDGKTNSQQTGVLISVYMASF